MKNKVWIVLNELKSEGRPSRIYGIFSIREKAFQYLHLKERDKEEDNRGRFYVTEMNMVS